MDREKWGRVKEIRQKGKGDARPKPRERTGKTRQGDGEEVARWR